MWLLLAFCSAAMLGLYDVAKKSSLNNNAVLPVLWCNTLFSSLFLVPTILDAELGLGLFNGTMFASTHEGLWAHGLIILKSTIVLTSWIFGYYGIKHLPITIVGPINASRPVMVLMGALLIFGERLNAWQWCGVSLAFVSLFLLARSSKREGVDFKHNKWILFVAISAISGAISGLYDKQLMQWLDPIFVQGWYNVYQFIMMSIVVGIIWLPRRDKGTPFQWRWSILFISIFLTLAEFAYLFALKEPDAMISIVSTVRRGSVVVSFICGAMLFKEKNLRSKAFDLVLILIGMIFLYIGSR